MEAESGIGVNLAIHAHEQRHVVATVGNVVSLGHAHALVAQLVKHHAVGLDVGSACAEAVAIEIFVVVLSVCSLVIFTWVGNDIVVLNRTAVDTNLGLNINGAVGRATLLGGDEDDAACATCTVESGRSSVLEHGHRLNLACRNLREVARIRSTVHDDQRIHSSVE